jgi:hypothetical protein
MKGLKKVWLIFVTLSLVLVNLYTVGWAEQEWVKDDPIKDEWNMMDLLVARPLGVGAGILGTGIFILALPFTIPTGSVDDAAQTFVVKPFKFSFVRKFPDDNM